MRNGSDRGDVGFPMRPDHAARDTRSRRLGCACLTVLVGVLFLVAVVCGAGLAWVVMTG